MSAIELPEPDTASLAMSGRSVDYINGYERGYEAAAEQVRQLIATERERCAKACEDLGARDWFEVGAVIRAATRECAAAIRRG